MPSFRALFSIFALADSENFAVGDVPAGEYRLAVMIDGARVWRRIRVEPGKVTFVEFHP